jgi:hypothetical protein
MAADLSKDVARWRLIDGPALSNAVTDRRVFLRMEAGRGAHNSERSTTIDQVS